MSQKCTQIQEMITSLSGPVRHFRLLPRCSWGFRPSGMLRSAGELVIDVSGRPIVSIFSGQAARLENVCNELAVRAAQRHRRAVTRVQSSSSKTNFPAMNQFSVPHMALGRVSHPKFCNNFMFHLTPPPAQATVMMQFTVHCIYIFGWSWPSLPLLYPTKITL